MDLREILFAQFPAFFLLSLLFLAEHLRVRKRSAVKSVLWVLLFGAALAVSILFCFLGMQAKYWTVKTLFKLKFWSWLGLAIVVVLLVLRIVFKLQNKHTRHVMEKERAKYCGQVSTYTVCPRRRAAAISASDARFVVWTMITGASAACAIRRRRETASASK